MSVRQWVESRTGAGAALESFFSEEIPASAGWAQVFGSVALFVLLVQASTGALLALNYSASPGDAYDSVAYIIREVTGGRIIRGLHHWGASMMVIVVALHALQVFLYGAYKKPREVTWLCGILLLLVVMGFALTGYLLPWDNRAYWGTVVTTEIARQVPGVGRILSQSLGAENGVGVVTFTRFYALHVILLPAITVLLTALHVYLVRMHGVAGSPEDTGPKRHFYPTQALKDTVAIFLAFLMLLGAAVFLNAPLERMADPTDSSYVPRPEWYFLFLFQTLKLVGGSLETFASAGLPTLAILCLVVLPFLDRKASKGWRNRGWAIGASLVAMFSWSALTYAAYRNSPHDASHAQTQPARQRLLALVPDELAGFDYFRQRNCARCHNVLEGDPKSGPTLATVVNRRPPEWVESHVQESLAGAATAPQLTSAQVNALVQFASKVNPEHALNLQQAPADLLVGADIFVRNLCTSCHKVNGSGGQTGPPLNGLSGRRSRDWVARHFANPKIVSPGTIMPPYHFSRDEQDQIIAYLFQLQ